jgi:hypothetical protein
MPIRPRSAWRPSARTLPTTSGSIIAPSRPGCPASIKLSIPRASTASAQPRIASIKRRTRVTQPPADSSQTITITGESYRLEQNRKFGFFGALALAASSDRRLRKGRQSYCRNPVILLLSPCFRRADHRLKLTVDGADEARVSSARGDGRTLRALRCPPTNRVCRRPELRQRPPPRRSRQVNRSCPTPRHLHGARPLPARRLCHGRSDPRQERLGILRAGRGGSRCGRPVQRTHALEHASSAPRSARWRVPRRSSPRTLVSAVS